MVIHGLLLRRTQLVGSTASGDSRAPAIIGQQSRLNAGNLCPETARTRQSFGDQEVWGSLRSSSSRPGPTTVLTSAC